jgi:sigma-E factor negative regulatory protein RseC
MSEGNIEHKGVIIGIDPEIISVEIINKSACSSCSSKGSCMLGESASKIVQVENKGYSFFEEGEEVNVILKKSLGFKALWVSYLIPLIVFIIVLLLMDAAGAGELLTGLSIIAVIGVYYFLVYLFRGRLKKEFVFTVEKLK